MATWRLSRVVVDTSSLIYAVDKRVDLVGVLLDELGGPLMLIVTVPVLRELALMSRTTWEARTALDIVRRYFSVARSHTDVPDDSLIEVASNLGAYVLTGDRKVRETARRMGLRCILLGRRGISVV